MSIYVGLYGCYRTFEETYNNLFINLIENNKNYNFDIYINTEYKKGYQHTKWNNSNKDYKYSQEKLDNILKKCYKSHLKNITYESLKKHNNFPRVTNLINDCKNNKKTYDLYIFIRLDCLLSYKINLDNYIKTFNHNNVKLICRDIVFEGRQDHNRDWNMGIISKNIDNIKTFILNDYKILEPDDNELKNLLDSVKCISIYKSISLPFPPELEYRYKKDWRYGFNKEVFSFNKLVAPLTFEDSFYLKIIR